MSPEAPPIDLSSSTVKALAALSTPNPVGGVQATVQTPLSKSVFQSMLDYAQRMGEAGAYQNAEFERTDPGLLRRIGYGLNPLTSLSSVVGQMHSAANAGDELGMLGAFVQGIPIRGVGPLLQKTTSLLKAGPSTFLQLGPAFSGTPLRQTLQRIGRDTAQNTTLDYVDKARQ